MKNNLEFAIRYLNMGWSIFPVKNGDKTPAIFSWSEYTKRPPTMLEITKWFSKNDDLNIAVVCGKISGIIVVDIDSGKGEPDILGLELPPTLSAKTGGGGTHVIYKWRKGLVGMQSGIRKLVDIRSDNSYIVVSPSLHASGNRYEWIDEDEEIADAPKWLELDTVEGEKKEPTDWGTFLSKKNEIGLRNSKATQVAGKLLYEMSRDLWDTLAIMTFKQWNKEYNATPLGDRELMSVWNSIKKIHSRSVAKDEVPPKIDNVINMPPEEEEEYIRKAFKKNKTQGTYYLASYIVKKYSIITIGEFEREMFVYRDGVYKRAENEVIYPEIQRILQDEVTKNAKSETVHKIADMTSNQREIFSTADLRYIPLQNGVYDLEDDILLPQDPKYKFKYKFPIKYDKDAKCPKTEAFFDQVLSPEQRTIVEEWIGYYFYRNYMFKKAMIFVGEGDTGKTTFLEVITFLLGRDNLSSISLQKMSSDKFSAAHLNDKHGNLVDELSANDIRDTGAFKIATGGGSITGEYKFGNQFSFVNFSKFTFACNKIPDVQDTDDSAYFNRWMPIRFENTIEKKIPNFIATVATEEERSGLFNLAMTGLRRLLRNEKFSYGKNATETKVEMMRSGSSIASFASEMLEKKDGNTIDKEEMYNAYTKYCRDNELSAQSMRMFGTKIHGYTEYVADASISILGVNGKYTTQRVWKNVKIRGEIEKEKVEEVKKDEGDFGVFND